MVTLRNMRHDEYPAYCEYFLDDYSQEIVENYGHSVEVARDLANKELQHSFPDGLQGTNHSLMCIDSEIDNKLCLVGYLWHSMNHDDSSTFIYDFYISDAYRGIGYGKQAISALEAYLHSVAIKQIKLRVAFQNKRALQLYQSVGFSITGYNMSKNIGC